MDDEKALAAFLASHSDSERLENGKVRCVTTKHEMQPSLAQLEAHWSGKRYKKAKAVAAYDFAQPEPYLIQHK